MGVLELLNEIWGVLPIDMECPKQSPFCRSYVMNRPAKIALAAAMLLAGTSILPGCNGATDDALNQVNDGPKSFMIKTLVRGDRSRKYGLFVPLTYNSNTSYPCIIFLHGMGEGGNDAKANLRVGLAPFVARRAADFGFICIFPQSDNGQWDENGQNAMDVIAELDAVSKMYNIDQDRVSLTGLSTGGYGTWAIGAKFKERFAALVPMGSSADPSQYAQVLAQAHMPIWSFHNSGDMFAASWNDSSMVNKIKTLGWDEPQYTEYSALGHDCWETAYGSGDLFAWLLQQRRHTGGSASTSGHMNLPVAAAPTRAAVPAVEAPARSNVSAMINTPY